MESDTVVAKFECTSRRQYRGWAGHDFFYEYEFMAVTGGSPENDSFFASTPSGNVKVAAVRDDLFVPGKQYYLTFTKAGSPA